MIERLYGKCFFKWIGSVDCHFRRGLDKWIGQRLLQFYANRKVIRRRDSHIVRGSIMVGASVDAKLEMSTFYQADYGDKLQQKWRELRNRCGGLVYHWNSCPDLEDQTKERNYRQSVTGFACRALQETADAVNGRGPSLIITMLRRRVWTRPVAITGHIYQTTFCCF